MRFSVVARLVPPARDPRRRADEVRHLVADPDPVRAAEIDQERDSSSIRAGFGEGVPFDEIRAA